MLWIFLLSMPLAVIPYAILWLRRRLNPTAEVSWSQAQYLAMLALLYGLALAVVLAFGIEGFDAARKRDATENARVGLSIAVLGIGLVAVYRFSGADGWRWILAPLGLVVSVIVATKIS